MSAYLTSPTKIGILAQAIAAHTNEHGDVVTIAKELAAENLRSVAYRYHTDADGAARDFRSISAAKYKRLCRDAANDPANAPADMSVATLLDIAGEYQYQSCECDDWPETMAAKMLCVLTAHAAQPKAA